MFLKMYKFWFLSTSVQILNLELKVFMLIPNPITSEYPNERQNIKEGRVKASIPCFTG